MAFLQSASLWVQQFAPGVAVLQLDPSGKAMRLTPETIAELDDALAAIDREAAFRLLVIRSLKGTSFCQGPDVAQWRGMKPEAFAPWVAAGQALWNRLRAFRTPTIAYVQGACLGAGFEWALACDRIVAVDRPATVFGFNELDVGLIPSWGSLGVLARRIGVQSAAPLALAGRRLNAREAVRLGVADRIVDAEDPDWQALADDPPTPARDAWRRRTWRQRWIERFAWGRRLAYRGLERLQRTRLAEDLPAPRAALETYRVSVESGDTAGQQIAATRFVELSASPAFANLLRQHELRDRRLGPHPERMGVPRKAKKIGVLGASPKSFRLILDVVRRGDFAVLRESDELRLGLSVMNLVRDLNREIQEGRMTTAESEKCLSRIQSTVTWKHFEEVDLVLDLRERPRLDRFAEIGEAAPAETVVAWTAPHETIANVAADWSNPGRVAGFCMPFVDVPFVEIRGGPQTSPDALRTLREWATRWGWTSVTTGDRPGLLLLRLWLPAWNEAVLLVREGARIERVDQALARFGLGRSLFGSLDDLGLERVEGWFEDLRAELEPRIPIDPFWAETSARGWTGRETGKGFYRRGRRPQPNHLLENWLHAQGPRVDVPRPQASADQLRHYQDRIALLTVNEAFRCLDEGRTASGDDLDFAMTMTDWAPHRGGPIRYAEQLGLDEVVRRLRGLTPHGERYEPCAGLVARAEKR